MNPPSGLYSAAQARELDRLATARFDIPSFELMTRAARAAARVIRERLPLAQRVVVACGHGNNGGDGYVLARLLKEAGRDVRVFALDGRMPVTDDGERAAKLWLEAGGRVDLLSTSFPDCDVLVDALFGIGLSRDLGGSAAAAVRAINQSGAFRIALDIASGLCADTGKVRGSAVQAELSIAFIVAKIGQYTGEGPAFSGDRIVESLNLPTALLQALPPDVEVMQREELHSQLPPRHRTAHKGQFGHVLVIGGDSGMGGAVRLAAEAALRSGAGLVSVATRAEHVAPLLAARPELMVRAVAGPSELKPMLERASVILAGPGLGQSAWSETLLLAAAQVNLPSVFDADALNLLAQGACLLPEHLVLTPHPGEAGRLLECSTAEVQADRVAALARLVQAFQVTVVLKGAGTLVSGERGKKVLCPFGNPGMATGGTGDVLAGIIAGLLAQRCSPDQAARLGVLAHALAADTAALDGERGMLASDLLIPLRGLLNGRPAERR